MVRLSVRAKGKSKEKSIRLLKIELKAGKEILSAKAQNKRII